MILRSIAQAIKRQDWFQVIIEIFIVVIGIFLGLQVTDWNDQRQDRAEEQGYLLRIEDELLKSIRMNEIVVQVALEDEGYFDIIMKSINTCKIEEGNGNEIASGLYNLTNTVPPSYLRSVIEELAATGKFQFIQNVSLRDAFSNYMESFTLSDRVALQTRQRIMPHVTFIEKQIVYRLKDASSFGRSFTRDEIIFDFNIFCKNEGNLEAISAISRFRQGYRVRAAVAIERQTELKAMIEVELEKFQ